MMALRCVQLLLPLDRALSRYSAYKTRALKTIRVNEAVAGAPQLGTPKPVDNYTNWTVAKNTDYLPLRFLKNSATACSRFIVISITIPLFLKKLFKQIHEKGIKNLIIDLRHNTEGYQDRSKINDLSGRFTLSDGRRYKIKDPQPGYKSF